MAKIHRKSRKKKKPSEPQKPVTVHRTGRSDRGPCRSLLFLYRTVLHPKQTVKLNGSRFFRSDRTVRSGFQNLVLVSMVTTNSLKWLRHCWRIKSYSSWNRLGTFEEWRSQCCFSRSCWISRAKLNREWNHHLMGLWISIMCGYGYVCIIMFLFIMHVVLF